MDVDNFISEEGNDPAGRKGQDPQLVGSLKQKISKSFKNKTGLQRNRKKIKLSKVLGGWVSKTRPL